MGGHININKSDKGNIFTVTSNAYAEFNMFLDPLAAKTVLKSSLNITLIPLATQRNLSSFQTMLNSLNSTDQTPEYQFVHRLLARLHALHQEHRSYKHVVEKPFSLPLPNKNDLVWFLTKLLTVVPGDVLRRDSWSIVHGRRPCSVEAKTTR